MKRIAIILALVAGCGGSAQWQTSDAYRAAYHVARTTCAVIDALPPPADPVPADGGAP